MGFNETAHSESLRHRQHVYSFSSHRAIGHGHFGKTNQKFKPKAITSYSLHEFQCNITQCFFEEPSGDPQTYIHFQLVKSNVEDI